MFKYYIEKLDNAYGVKPSIIKMFESAGKGEAFMKFIKLLPSGLPTQAALGIINHATPTEIKNAIPYLYSKSSPEQIKDYTEFFKVSFLQKLFMAQNKGIGRGELFMAFLIRNAKVSGGNESFDLSVGSRIYEIKEYLAGNSAIRLGVEGSVNKFYFWKEILMTIYIVEQFKNELKRQKELKEHILYILDRAATIRSGEFNKKDLKNFQEFYEVLNNIFKQKDIKENEYTQTVFQGPAVASKKIKIKPIDDVQLEQKDKLTIQKTGADENSVHNILIEFNKIKYPRNPKMFSRDIQKAVDSITANGLQFVIFRKNGYVAITNEFYFSNISQNGIKIIEKSLKNKEED